PIHLPPLTSTLFPYTTLFRSYILLNPAMNGLLKVGKTTREPADRVVELSAATGVPTPFILAYRTHTGDCHRLEQVVHSLLAEKRSEEHTSELQSQSNLVCRLL